MNRKPFLLAVAAVLAAGGLWFARSTWRTPEVQESNVEVGVETPSRPAKSGQIQAPDESSVGIGSENASGAAHPDPRLRPPEPNRRFIDFTPEQRVEFARKGHGPGG